MTKHLQVRLDEAELKEVQRAARARRMSVAEWVRQALRAAWRRESNESVAKKLKVLQAASRHAFPVGDIDQMLSEIDRGYLGRNP